MTPAQGNKELHKELARLRKAAKLAVRITRSYPNLPKSRRIVERALANLDLRRQVESAAGVRRSSDDTWQLVIDLLS